jgi:DNA polymerase-3 subunit gamma/tau
MRDALSLTDQVLSLGEGVVSAARVRDALGLVHEDEHLALLDLIVERRAGDVFTAVGRLADGGVDFSVLLSDFADLLRAQLAVVLGGSLPDLSDHLREELPRRAATFAAGDLLRMLAMIVELEPHIRRSSQQQMLFETLLVRFALLDRTVALEEVLRGVSAGGGGGGGAPRAGPPSPRSAAPPTLRDAAPARSAASPRPEPREEPRPEPRVRPEAELADAAPAGPASLPLELNRVAEHWDAIVDGVERDGRAVLAAALRHATPTAVTAAGGVTLTVDAAAQEDLIVQGEAAILTALQRRFAGATRITVRAARTEAAAPRRLSEQEVRADRMGMLRKQSKLLDAAGEALDLELLD